MVIICLIKVLLAVHKINLRITFMRFFLPNNFSLFSIFALVIFRIGRDKLTNINSCKYFSTQLSFDLCISNIDITFQTLLNNLKSYDNVGVFPLF